MTKRAGIVGAIALTIVLAAFVGSALAGNGNGNGAGQGNGNGNSQATPATPSTSPGPGNSANAPGHNKTSSSATTSSSGGGGAKGSASQNAGSQAGMKPTNATTHWAKCTTGGSASSATCAAASSNTAGVASGKSDVSKRYGNGTTAAQIAVSRGGVGVELTGPGNSQPHKVAVCPHKNNRSGGVDVHAIKNFATTCESAEQTQTTQQQHIANTTVVMPTQASVTTPTVSSAAATQASSGVLGVTAATSSPSKSPGGVAGALAAVGNVAGETLPFTGFELWFVALMGFGVIVLGVALRRAGRATI